MRQTGVIGSARTVWLVSLCIVMAVASAYVSGKAVPGESRPASENGTFVVLFPAAFGHPPDGPEMAWIRSLLEGYDTDHTELPFPGAEFDRLKKESLDSGRRIEVVIPGDLWRNCPSCRAILEPNGLGQLVAQDLADVFWFGWGIIDVASSMAFDGVTADTMIAGLTHAEVGGTLIPLPYPVDSASIEVSGGWRSEAYLISGQTRTAWIASSDRHLLITQWFAGQELQDVLDRSVQSWASLNGERIVPATGQAPSSSSMSPLAEPRSRIGLIITALVLAFVVIDSTFLSLVLFRHRKNKRGLIG